MLALIINLHFKMTLQLLMFVFRLGILSFLLSECLVSGFTTGAAMHVFTSQVKDLLGLELPRISGNFKLVKVNFDFSLMFFVITFYSSF